MMIDRVKLKARKLLFCNRIFSKPSLKEIKKLITAKGYELIEFDNSGENDAEKELIRILHLEEKIQKHNGFTYKKANYRFVFVNKNLPDDDKLSVLYHELGHICDDKGDFPEYMYSSIKKEEYANEFSFHLKHSALKNKLTAIILALTLVSGIALTEYNSATAPASSQSQMLYVTQTGKRYHQSFCKHVKYKENTRALSLSKAKAEHYTPCLDCIGN